MKCFKADGTIAAKYEYDPYGKRINTASPGEYDQPYRFSTKPVDEETGLGYWGYRYYSYDLGRWVSRDPKEEDGGFNLYAYVNNGSQERFDSLGLQGEVCCKYRSETIHAGLGISDYVMFTQETKKFAGKVSNPKECCSKARPKDKITAGRSWTSVSVASADDGPCCSCRVQLRRQEAPHPWLPGVLPDGSYGNHVSVAVKCTDGKRWLLEHAGRDGGLVGGHAANIPSNAKKNWIGIDNTIVLRDLCVSCETAARVVEKARSLDGEKYGLKQDCHWFTREVLRGIGKNGTVWSTDDCPSIP